MGAWGIFTLTLPGSLEGKQTRRGSHIISFASPDPGVPGDFFHSVWGFERWVAPAVRKWISRRDYFSFFSCLLLVAQVDQPPHPNGQFCLCVLTLTKALVNWIEVKSNNTPWTGHKSMEWLTTTELQPWTPCLITLTTGWSSVCQHR